MGRPAGFKHTDETKARMRVAHLTRKRPDPKVISASEKLILDEIRAVADRQAIREAVARGSRCMLPKSSPVFRTADQISDAMKATLGESGPNFVR